MAQPGGLCRNSDQAVSVTAAGQLVTVFALGYAVGSPLLGTVTANLPRRSLLVLAMLLLALANLASALAHTYALLTFARLASLSTSRKLRLLSVLARRTRSASHCCQSAVTNVRGSVPGASLPPAPV